MTQRPEPYEHLVADRVFDGLDRLGGEADARGTTTAALAFAWALSNPSVAAVVCGPNRPDQLDPVLAARDLDLTGDDRDRIGGFFA